MAVDEALLQCSEVNTRPGSSAQINGLLKRLARPRSK